MREALKVVIDPELGLNVVDLGLIYGVDVNDEGKVSVRMTLTTPGCPLYATLNEQVEAAVRPLPGVRTVETELVWDPPWNPDMMSEEAKRLLRWGIR
nr:iron-sulfur cluster assembly protein [Limnochorda pilosa]